MESGERRLKILKDVDKLVKLSSLSALIKAILKTLFTNFFAKSEAPWICLSMDCLPSSEYCKGDILHLNPLVGLDQFI